MKRFTTYFSVVSVLLLITGCGTYCCDEEPIGELPKRVTIDAIELTRLDEEAPDGDPWDEDGSGPDVFVRFARRNFGGEYVISDTLRDVTIDTPLRMNIMEELVVTPLDSMIVIQLLDEDYRPGIPEVFQSDQIIAEIRTNPWLGHPHFAKGDNFFFTLLGTKVTVYLTQEY